MNTSGVFKNPFQEQVAFFRNKLGNQVSTERWTDLQKSQHDTAFMVAGAQKADLLSDLAAAVDKSISQGMSLDEFRKDFKDIRKRHGWEHTGDFNWRTKVIYQTNMSTSYAAGRWAQLTNGDFSHIVYKHSRNVEHPRLQHLAWDGLTLPVDDVFWQTHAPPNGWGCQCRLCGIRRPEDAGRFGGDIDRPRPSLEIDPSTDEPVGISKGWGYAPGSNVANTVRAMAEKTVQWEYTLAKEYMLDLPENIKDSFAHSYRSLPSTRASARRFAKRIMEKRRNDQEYQTLGLIESSRVKQIQEFKFRETDDALKKRNEKRATKNKEPVTHAEFKSLDVKGFDYALNESSINHIRKKHGVPDKGLGESVNSQKPVKAEDYEMMSEILNDPDSVYSGGVSGIQLPMIMFKKTIGKQTYVLGMEYASQRQMLIAKTFYIHQKGK